MRQFVYRFSAMSTACELIVFAQEKKDADHIAELIVHETKRLEKKYNYYDPASFLSQLNNRQIDLLDRESANLLERAKRYYTLTDGVFDISIATFKALYTTCDSAEKLFHEKKRLMPYVGCEHFKIKKERLIFDNPHTMLDLGGFVKEYAVDRAAALVKKAKLFAALINFGGDIYAHGIKPDGNAFRIGIKDPTDPSRHATDIALHNQAIATSASYERHYTIGTVTLSHIFSKEDAKNLHNSVSIISNNCVECGVFATALMANPRITTKHRHIIL